MLTTILLNALKEIKFSQNIKQLEQIKFKYLGKKGYFNKYINNINILSHKKIFCIINNYTKILKLIYNKYIKKINKKIILKKINKQKIDISIPGNNIQMGGLHPITIIINKLENLLKKFCFNKINIKEIDDIHYNFDSLNIPLEHSSRTFKDTFWLNNNKLLRTHTSSIQNKILRNKKPPIRIMATSKVYRKDYDKIHTPMFHQIEGIFIGKNINFSNLKDFIYNILYMFFKKKYILRFRPTFFSFTKPSAEIDIKINNNWLEILGCGIIHPNILRNVLIDPNIYSGFAFGIGIERLTMLYYKIDDIRFFFENNFKFLKQFK